MVVDLNRDARPRRRPYFPEPVTMTSLKSMDMAQLFAAENPLRLRREQR
jgi:hypothetical protein